MIELVEGAIYKSTSGRVKYTGIDRFHGEQTFRFKRLERVGTDYIFLDKIEEFICVEGEEKTYDEIASMNKELLEVIERVIVSSKEFDKIMGASEWADGYKQCAIDTGEALRGIIENIKAKASS